MPFAVARDFMVLPVLLVYFILPITSRRPRQTSPVVRSVQFCPPSAFSRHDMAALALHAKITTIAKIILRNNIMISVIHNPPMSIWLFDTSAFNKRADGGGADVQAAGDVARFFVPDLRHYNPLFLFRKIIVDAIL